MINKKISILSAFSLFIFSLFPISNVFADSFDDLFAALQISDYARAQSLSESILNNRGTLTPSRIDFRFPAGAPDSGTLLYYASRAGQTEIVEKLLASGANPNTFNGKFNSTPLMSAAHFGSIPTVEALLRVGAKVGERNSAKNTALHTAINNQKWPILKVLLQGATLSDLNIPDKMGKTPRQLAHDAGIDLVENRYHELTSSGSEETKIRPETTSLKDKILKKISDSLSSTSTYRMDEIQLESLHKAELTEVVNSACANRQESNFSAKLCFDARDQIIRNVLKNPGDLSHYQTHCIDPLIKSLDLSKTQFHTFESKTSHSSSTLKESQIKVARDFNPSKKKLLVFHGSVSYHGTAGGMGAFLESFIHSQEKHRDSRGESDLEGRELTAFYEFLKLDLFGPKTKGTGRDAFPLIKFVGFVDHEVDGKMRKSSIYEAETDGIKQYLIQPDPSYHAPGSSDRGTDLLVRGRYETYDETGKVYFSSAMAAIASLYCGEGHDETVDILMAHDRNMVMLPALMRLQYNQKREEAGLSRIPTVAVLHTQNGLTYSRVSDTTFTRAGLPKPVAPSLPLFTVHSVFADSTVAVSRNYATELSTTATHGKDLGLGEMYSDLESAGLFGGITSGIETNRFSPTDPSALGPLAIKGDLSNYTEMKNRTKKTLFEAGIIPSESKPLYLYVGRFDEIKGIDTLPDFAKIIMENGGQVVIMGPGTGSVVPAPIAKVISMQHDPQYRGMIKVYTNYENDQKAPLPSVDTQTRRGHLIRFASDFTFVPSVSEACGLVPIEALAMGNGLITSYVSGLKDLCKPINKAGPQGQIYDENHFSCVAFDRSYPRFSSTIADLKRNIENFLEFWNNLTPSERESHHKRWIAESKTFSWGHPGGAMDQYKALFLALLSPGSPEQEIARQRLIDKWVTLEPHAAGAAP